MRKLKSMFLKSQAFPVDTVVLTSYLSGIYLEPWFSWLLGGVQKTLKKKKKAEEK